MIPMKPYMLFAVAGIFLSSCAKDPSKAAFTGTWNFTEENSITNASDTVQMTVLSLPPKFRQSTKSQSSEVTLVYDGASLHTKTSYMPSASPYAMSLPFQEAESQAPQVHTESVAMSADQAAAKRFWAEPLTGKSAPGGLIAGRDTVLYESKWKRPDGEFSTQIWVDAQTGVMLKQMESVYSSQAQTLVRRAMKECVSIDFTAPEDAAFARP